MISTYIYIAIKSACVYSRVKMAAVHIWDCCDVVTDHLVHLHRGERHVN